MRTLLLAALCCSASNALAQSAFRFDERTGSCRDEQGLEGLNQGVTGPCGDLRNGALAGVDFADLDLRGARLDGANLEGASFFRADLRQATLASANLNRAVLTGARLEGASLEQASLIGAHLEHACLASTDLRHSDLRQASLYRTRFQDADLRGARFSSSRGLLEGAQWATARIDALTALPFSPAERAQRRLTLVAGEAPAAAQLSKTP